jgi:hypothetical protein
MTNLNDFNEETEYKSNEYDYLEQRIEKIEYDLKDGGQYIGEQLGKNAIIASNKVSFSFILIYVPGLVLAMILSWSVNSSIILAILHGYLSWLYVIYQIIF